MAQLGARLNGIQEVEGSIPFGSTNRLMRARRAGNRPFCFYCFGVIFMRHYYSTVDGIILTHSDLYVLDEQRMVCTRFKRLNETGFDYAEETLPFASFNKTYRFSEDELFELAD